MKKLICKYMYTCSDNCNECTYFEAERYEGENEDIYNKTYNIKEVNDVKRTKSKNTKKDIKKGRKK